MFKPESQSFPPLNMHSSISTFTKQVSSELSQLSISFTNTSNLDPNLRGALKSLQTNPHIIIKPADKGGNIVIVDREQYAQMCLKILKNRDWYEVSDLGVLKKAQVNLSNIICEAFDDGVNSDDTRDFLIQRFPRVPTFYALPKIHKQVYPPGKPIVSGEGRHTEGIGVFIDHYLQSHVTSLPS